MPLSPDICDATIDDVRSVVADPDMTSVPVSRSCAEFTEAAVPAEMIPSPHPCAA